MRLLLLLFIGVALPAQDAGKSAADPASPPAEESRITGSVEVGYRWRTDVAGSFDTYRSVVDLGAGPKLFGADFTLVDPARQLFDQIDVHAQNWGDDPYSTVLIRARKQRLYDFTADYRNMAYFNALPSFGNPLLSRDILLSERSFDIRRRLVSVQLDLLSGGSVIPYLAFERSSGYGNGVTTFVSNANEYAVPNRIRDANDTYRAGVRLEFARFHATGEIGRTAFRDDQQVFDGSGINAGNRGVPYLGQTLFLTRVQQSYGVRGQGVLTKGLFTSNPLRWLDIYGQILYSRPETTTHYEQRNEGNFALSGALFVASQQFALSSGARMPHAAGSAGAEVRPWKRTRVLASWLTDRLESTSDLPLGSLLRNVFNQTDLDMIVDLTAQLTVRGGYRYRWGDGQNVAIPASGLLKAERAELRRHSGIASLTYRPAQGISVNADYERATSGAYYFRTSLNDTHKFRLRARYQITTALTLAADVSALTNRNPSPGLDYDFAARSSSLSVLWRPADGRHLLLHGSYSRSTVHSDITYLAPQFFEQERSAYRDYAHTADALIDITLPQRAGQPAKVSLGGICFFSSGSRPTRHYQPTGTLDVPITKSVAWVSTWRYHGFSERFYGFEGFRTHLITTGIRLSR